MESLARILYSLHRGTPQHGAWVVACLDGAWTNLVGEGLARVCRPITFEDSELLIEVLDPAWEKPLRDVRSDIEAKLHSATGGEVRRIKLEFHK